MRRNLRLNPLHLPRQFCRQCIILQFVIDLSKENHVVWLRCKLDHTNAHVSTIISKLILSKVNNAHMCLFFYVRKCMKKKEFESDFFFSFQNSCANNYNERTEYPLYYLCSLVWLLPQLDSSIAWIFSIYFCSSLISKKYSEWTREKTTFRRMELKSFHI